MQGFYGQFLRFRELAFDIGANVGQHTAMMLKRGARVVAVEPQSELARRLTQRFPSVDVLAVAVGDQPGTETMMSAVGNDRLSTLNPSWRAAEARVQWRDGETVQVTTMDELIARFGVPALVKIDTEGFEDRVLRGLTTPIRHLLFEVHADLPDVAARGLAELEELGRYEYRVMERESWEFSRPTTADAVLRDLPDWGDVHARLRS